MAALVFIFSMICFGMVASAALTKAGSIEITNIRARYLFIIRLFGV
jgi:hypothetical protein